MSFACISICIIARGGQVLAAQDAPEARSKSNEGSAARGTSVVMCMLRLVSANGRAEVDADPARTRSLWRMVGDLDDDASRRPAADRRHESPACVVDRRSDWSALPLGADARNHLRGAR
jgi:hypothetical protein